MAKVYNKTNIWINDGPLFSKSDEKYQFSNLRISMNPKQDTHKITPRYIINTVLKTSDEENILNSSQSERHVTQRGTEFKMLKLVKRTEWPIHGLFFSLKPSSPRRRRMEQIFALNYLLSYIFTFWHRRQLTVLLVKTDRSSQSAQMISVRY